MTKSEIIGELIEKGLTFEQVVEQSECKAGYVKGQYTKRGLKWDAEPEVVATIGGEVIKGFSENDILEVSLEDIPEDTEIKDIPLVIETKEEEPEEEDPLEDNYKECFECLGRVELKNVPYMTKARCSKYVELAKQVLITKDLTAARLNSLNARYNYIIPKPAGRNASVKVLALHKAMTKLFRAHYKK